MDSVVYETARCPAQSAFALFLSLLVKPIFLPQPDLEDKYDFILVGGGTAGCVLANRLSEISSWKVVLLEAGGEEPEVSLVPSLTSTILQSKTYNWHFLTEPQPESCGGVSCIYERGKMLGGSSSHNYMVYSRGNKASYDMWRDAGNPGWSYKDVLPYFRKSENNRDKDTASDHYHHGIGGFQDVQRPIHMDENFKGVVEALEEVGYDEVDVNGYTQKGFMRSQLTYSDGERKSTSTSFLKPIRSRNNLHVRTNTLVTKLIIDPETKKAVGVECMLDNTKRHVLYAEKEVIVCAGVVKSPQLLQLSGIGPSKLLEKLGIPVVCDLPGVGLNFHDQVISDTAVAMLLGPTSKLPGSCDLVNKDIIEYNRKRTGNLADFPIIYLYLRSPKETNDIPDVMLNFIGRTINCSTKLSGIPRFPYYDQIFISPTLAVSYSRGKVYINSTDPFDPPRFKLNFLKDPRDVDALVYAFDAAMKISEAESLKKLGMTVDRTPNPACTQYEYGSKQYWKCAISGNVREFAHGVGTCKMGPRSDPQSVVDHHLKVHGISRLRVIDASIMPLLPNSHTNAPTMMIAEKSADVIIQEWTSLKS